MLAAEEEDVVVVSHDAVDEAVLVQPGALGLRLNGSNDVRQPEHLQQLLALAVHVAGGRVGDARLLAVLLGQPLQNTQGFSLDLFYLECISFILEVS